MELRLFQFFQNKNLADCKFLEGFTKVRGEKGSSLVELSITEFRSRHKFESKI